MLLRVSVLVAVLAMACAAAASAGPPGAGILVPGKSLGGLQLGVTLAQVEDAWGRAYGRCRSCRRTTLYFNLYAYRPAGAGVELRRGRVSAVFTVWAPGAWRTREGVQVGDGVADVTATYGPMTRTDCEGYYALSRRSGGVTSAVYVVGAEVWGLGLLARGSPICR
jgi:hypothetical protein